MAYRPGHGLMLEIKLKQEKVPGEKPAREISNPMNIYDRGAVEYLCTHSENAFIIQPDGTISHRNVSLPVDLDAHEERYDISDLAETLGYVGDPDGVGGRAIAAMCGTEARGEVSAVLNLHRCTSKEQKNHIGALGKGNIPILEDLRNTNLQSTRRKLIMLWS